MEDRPMRRITLPSEILSGASECRLLASFRKTLLDYCIEIWRKVVNRKCRFKLQTEELQSRLNFLRQRFDDGDDGNADGAMKADVSIVVQDRKDEVLHAHKFVLAGKSPVFCKMFEINMLESETGFVRIDDATLPVMRAVIKFCYNAEINFTDEMTLEEVLEVAHKYGIDLLVKTCEKLLIQTIDKVNLQRRLKLAKKFEAKLLHARVLEYLKTHFDDVIDAFVDELF